MSHGLSPKSSHGLSPKSKDKSNSNANTELDPDEFTIVEHMLREDAEDSEEKSSEAKAENGSAAEAWCEQIYPGLKDESAKKFARVVVVLEKHEENIKKIFMHYAARCISNEIGVSIRKQEFQNFVKDCKLISRESAMGMAIFDRIFVQVHRENVVGDKFLTVSDFVNTLAKIAQRRYKYLKTYAAIDKLMNKIIPLAPKMEVDLKFEKLYYHPEIQKVIGQHISYLCKMYKFFALLNTDNEIELVEQSMDISEFLEMFKRATRTRGIGKGITVHLMKEMFVRCNLDDLMRETSVEDDNKTKLDFDEFLEAVGRLFYVKKGGKPGKAAAKEFSLFLEELEGALFMECNQVTLTKKDKKMFNWSPKKGPSDMSIRRSGIADRVDQYGEDSDDDEGEGKANAGNEGAAGSESKGERELGSRSKNQMKRGPSLQFRVPAEEVFPPKLHRAEGPILPRSLGIEFGVPIKKEEFEDDHSDDEEVQNYLVNTLGADAHHFESSAGRLDRNQGKRGHGKYETGGENGMNKLQKYSKKKSINPYEKASRDGVKLMLRGLSAQNDDSTGMAKDRMENEGMSDNTCDDNEAQELEETALDMLEEKQISSEETNSEAKVPKLAKIEGSCAVSIGRPSTAGPPTAISASPTTRSHNTNVMTTQRSSMSRVTQKGTSRSVTSAKSSHRTHTSTYTRMGPLELSFTKLDPFRRPKVDPEPCKASEIKRLPKPLDSHVHQSYRFWPFKEEYSHHPLFPKRLTPDVQLQQLRKNGFQEDRTTQEKIERPRTAILTAKNRTVARRRAKSAARAKSASRLKSVSPTRLTVLSSPGKLENQQEHSGEPVKTFRSKKQDALLQSWDRINAASARIRSKRNVPKVDVSIGMSENSA